MELIQFGNTALKVSRIGLGLAALGRPGYINLGHGEDLNSNYDVGAMQTNTLQMLDLAYEKGIRYFDAARSYGKAELFLSEWIKTRDNNDHFTVGSKWGYTYTADWKVEAEKHEVKEHSTNVFNRQNVVHVYSRTGKPFDTGLPGLVGSSPDADHDPTHVGPPRIIKTGIQLLW